MSTLVAYDSSSDDDDEPRIKGNVPSVLDNTPAVKDVAQTESALRSKVNDAPWVGPSIPSDFKQSYEHYDDAIATEPPTIERDMIRYMTQASHPMTEMPPSPPGSPNASTAARFKHFLDLKTKGVHFNEDLARKPAFKNPALLQILMDRAGLDVSSANRTSLPLSVLDPSTLPVVGYKEALLKSQQTIRTKADMEKKALAAAGKRTVEFTSGGISGASSATSSPGGPHKRQKK